MSKPCKTVPLLVDPEMVFTQKNNEKGRSMLIKTLLMLFFLINVSVSCSAMHKVLRASDVPVRHVPVRRQAPVIRLGALYNLIEDMRNQAYGYLSDCATRSVGYPSPTILFFDSYATVVQKFTRLLDQKLADTDDIIPEVALQDTRTSLHWTIDAAEQDEETTYEQLFIQLKKRFDMVQDLIRPYLEKEVDLDRQT